MEGTSDSEFNEIAQANYNKLSTARTKAGYKDGITDGRDAVFQHGFDIGYSDGLKTAFEIAKWRTVRDLARKEDAQQKLPNEHPVLDAPEQSHHQFLKDDKLSVEEVSKQQTDYIETIKSKFDEDLKEIKYYFQ